MTMYITRFFIVVASTFMLSACQLMPTKSDIPPKRDYFPEANKPHDSDLEGNPTRVLFTLASLEGIQDELRIQQELLGRINRTLNRSKVKFLEVASTSRADIQREIQLAQRKSLEGIESTGTQKTNAIIIGVMDESSLETRYSTPLSNHVKNIVDKEDKPRPGKCKYKARAGISFEIEELPLKRRVKKWNLVAEKSDSFKALGSCQRPEEAGVNKQLSQELREAVLKDLSQCASHLLSDYFSPEAYILNYHSDGEIHLFEISGGIGAGFERGDSVMIERIGAIQDGSSVTKIGTANVIKGVQERRAYIKVGKADLANQVKKYDRVSIQKNNKIPNFSCRGVTK